MVRLRNNCLASEHIGRAVPIETIVSELQKFEAISVIKELCRISHFVFIANFSGKLANNEEYLFNLYFDSEILSLIKRNEKGFECFPFSRHALLFLLRLVLKNLSSFNSKKKINKKKDCLIIGKCIFWISDHLEDQDKKDLLLNGVVEEKEKAFLRSFAITTELNFFANPVGFQAACIYGKLLKDEILKIQQGSDNNLKEITGHLFEGFKGTTGLELGEFVEILFLVLFYGITFKKEDLINGKLPIIQTEVFIENTIIPLQTCCKVLETISITKEDFHHKLRSQETNNPQETNNQNFSFFRKSPLLKIEQNKFLILDLGYLTEFAFSGIYNLASENPKEYPNAKSGFGKIFEIVADQILSKIFPKPCNPSETKYFPNISYRSSKEEAFDSLIKINDRHFYILQYKSILMKDKIKYEGTFGDLERDLNSKFGRSRRDAAISQIVTNIKHCWKNSIQDRKVLEVELPTPSVVTPIVLVQEPFFLSHLLNYQLNTWLQEEFGGERDNLLLKINPVCVIHIFDLIRILNLIEKENLTLDEVILEFNSWDKTGKQKGALNFFLFAYSESRLIDEGITEFSNLISTLKTCFKS
jgi:hypothetical protein